MLDLLHVRHFPALRAPLPPARGPTPDGQDVPSQNSLHFLLLTIRLSLFNGLRLEGTDRGQKRDKANLTAPKSSICQRYARTSARLQRGAVPSPQTAAEAPRGLPAARTYDVTSSRHRVGARARRRHVAAQHGGAASGTQRPLPLRARLPAREPFRGRRARLRQGGGGGELGRGGWREGEGREWSVMCSVMCSVSLRLRLTRVRVSPQKEQDPNAASLLDIFSYWVKWVLPGGGGILLGAVPRSSVHLSVSLQVSCRQEKEARVQRASGKADGCLEQQWELQWGGGGGGGPACQEAGWGGKGPRWVGNLTLLWVRHGGCGSGEAILQLSGSRATIWS